MLKNLWTGAPGQESTQLLTSGPTVGIRAYFKKIFLIKKRFMSKKTTAKEV